MSHNTDYVSTRRNRASDRYPTKSSSPCLPSFLPFFFFLSFSPTFSFSSPSPHFHSSFCSTISILEHILPLRWDLPAIFSVYHEFVSTLQGWNTRPRPGVGTSVNSRKTVYLFTARGALLTTLKGFANISALLQFRCFSKKKNAISTTAGLCIIKRCATIHRRTTFPPSHLFPRSSISFLFSPPRAKHVTVTIETNISKSFSLYRFSRVKG